METRNPSISPLRQRMIEDMRMRKFGEKTQYQYVRAYYHLDDQALSAVPAIEPHGIQRFHVGQ